MKIQQNKADFEHRMSDCHPPIAFPVIGRGTARSWLPHHSEGFQVIHFARALHRLKRMTWEVITEAGGWKESLLGAVKRVLVLSFLATSREAAYKLQVFQIRSDPGEFRSQKWPWLCGELRSDPYISQNISFSSGNVFLLFHYLQIYKALCVFLLRILTSVSFTF